MMYRVCPHCGAHLDHCEVCDCQETEKGRSGAADTETAKADKKDSVSASYFNGMRREKQV